MLEIRVKTKMKIAYFQILGQLNVFLTFIIK